ncbi:MAG: lysophospholipid acyltransferase family protein [Candidatus Omnitrophica bacterium]|nr:lysophospholipid acyltransferase family protein [Candidatus Omnitrophota bacterium]
MAEQAISSWARYPVAAFFFSLFLGILRFLPWCVFRPCGCGAIRFFYILSPKLRRNSMESLDIAFGSGMVIREKRRLAARSFFHLAEGIAWFIYAIEHPRLTEKFFVWEGKELLDQVLMRGKGAVIAIAHLGPFVWMLQHFANHGYKTNIVMRPPRSSFLKVRFLEACAQLRMNFIYSVPLRACVVDSFAALARGELVFMPIDQNYGGNGRVFVDFFGRKAATAPGVVGYGLKTGAPVMMAYCLPLGDGRFKIKIDPELAMVGEQDEKAALVRNTAILTSRLETLIRQYPDQWSWMHRRWKAVPREGEV